MSHAEPDPFLSHAESTRVEDTCTASHAEPHPSLPDAESTRVEDMSHAEPDPSPPSTEESSLQNPTPAEQSNMAPSSWSVFMKSNRMNNDIEGWHLGLNRRAAGKPPLPLYLLISLLYREARLTLLQLKKNQARFREDVTGHSAEEVPEPPDEDLRLIGCVQLWRLQYKKAPEG